MGGLAGRLSKASPEINKNSFPYINNKQVNSSMKILPKYRVAVPPSRQTANKNEVITWQRTILDRDSMK